jgi:hypothetical protein
MKPSNISAPISSQRSSTSPNDFDVDADAVVSPGGDPGAWVMSWLWISDQEAGLETDDEDDDAEEDD